MAAIYHLFKDAVLLTVTFILNDLQFNTLFNLTLNSPDIL